MNRIIAQIKTSFVGLKLRNRHEAPEDKSQVTAYTIQSRSLAKYFIFRWERIIFIHIAKCLMDKS